MSERQTISADGAWHQIGIGPATVELISTGVSIMLVVSATEPTGSDGLILTSQGQTYAATLAQPIWAQAINGGAVIAVQAESPASASISSVTAMTIGTAYPAGRSVVVVCTVAGNVALTLADGSTLTVPVAVGLTILPFAVTEVNTAGTTATATYNLGR